MLILIIFIACSLKNSQTFFMQSLPLYTSCLFSRLLKGAMYKGGQVSSSCTTAPGCPSHSLTSRKLKAKSVTAPSQSVSCSMKKHSSFDRYILLHRFIFQHFDSKCHFMYLLPNFIPRINFFIYLKAKNVEQNDTVYNISHKLLIPSQFLELFLKFWNGQFGRKKSGPSHLLIVAAYCKSSKTQACVKKLS